MVQIATVLGGGSFGTVLANIMANNSHDVRLWARDTDAVHAMNRYHRNVKYLPDYELNANLKVTADLDVALSETQTLIFCVPSNAYRTIARLVKSHLGVGIDVVSTAKGLEPDCFKLMSETLKEELSPNINIGILGGPNIALELARHEITATVIASADLKMAERIHKLLYCPYLRVYRNADWHGVELAGVLKNIYAIIGGIASGLGVGYNSKGLLITRALAEMRRFAVSYGAHVETFIGLAGNGDLIVTCLSPESRNFRFGVLLGQGHETKDAVKEIGQTVEGLNTLKVIYAESQRRKLYMPLMEGLYQMVYENVEISALLDGMMHAQQREDVETPQVLFESYD